MYCYYFLRLRKLYYFNAYGEAYKYSYINVLDLSVKNILSNGQSRCDMKYFAGTLLKRSEFFILKNIFNL